MTSPCTRPELAARLLDTPARVGAEPIAALVPAILRNRRLFVAAGASAGSIVVLEEAGVTDFFAAVLAAWSLDAIPLPCRVAPDLPLARTAIMLTARRQVRPAVANAPPSGLDCTAVLHVTSGTTGTPKLAKRGIASVLGEADGYRRGLALADQDRVYVAVPLAHSYGWGVAFAALMAGCRLDAEPMHHPRMAARRLESEASVVAVTAPLARLLVNVAGRVTAGDVDE